MLDKKEGSTDILMNDKVLLEELDSVDFERNCAKRFNHTWSPEHNARTTN